MIYSPQEGLGIIEKFKKTYECEFECLSLSLDFMSEHILFNSLEKYKKLKQDFPDNVIVKETEFHKKYKPHYECSLFCSKEQKDKFELILMDRGITIKSFRVQ